MFTTQVDGAVTQTAIVMLCMICVKGDSPPTPPKFSGEKDGDLSASKNGYRWLLQADKRYKWVKMPEVKRECVLHNAMLDLITEFSLGPRPGKNSEEKTNVAVGTQCHNEPDEDPNNQSISDWFSEALVEKTQMDAKRVVDYLHETIRKQHVFSRKMDALGQAMIYQDRGPVGSHHCLVLVQVKRKEKIIDAAGPSSASADGQDSQVLYEDVWYAEWKLGNCFLEKKDDGSIWLTVQWKDKLPWDGANTKNHSKEYPADSTEHKMPLWFVQDFDPDTELVDAIAENKIHSPMWTQHLEGEEKTKYDFPRENGLIDEKLMKRFRKWDFTGKFPKKRCTIM